MDRLRGYGGLSDSDKLRYISKTLKDFDNALLYHKDLPADGLNQHGGNYLKFIQQAQEFLNLIADKIDPKDKEKS